MITRFSAAALVAAAASLSHIPASAAEPARFDILRHERVAAVQIERSPGSAALGKQRGRAERMRFRAMGRDFDLGLESNERIAAAAALPGPLADGRLELYRGTLGAQSDTWARVSLLDGALYALIWDGLELYAIEPASRVRDLLTAADERSGSVIYRLSDVEGVFQDEVLLPAPATGGYTQLVEELQAGAGAALSRRLDLALVGDAELEGRYADPESELLLRANFVDGIYAEQLGLQINVAEIVLHTREPDPFTGTSPSALLGAAGSLRSRTPELAAQALVHLFTGRELDGSTVGIAYVGTVCDEEDGVGLTEASASVVHDALIAAHEIGHNLGARHDAEPGSPCAATPPTYLMAPELNGSDRFSQCSVSAIQATIARAGCLEAPHENDVRVLLEVPGTVLLGDEASARVIVDNLGRHTATSLLLTLSAGTGLSLEANDCTAVGDELRCTLSSLAPGARAEIAVGITGTIPGSIQLAGLVYSSGDTNAANDVTHRSVIVEPAVILAVEVQPGQVALGSGDSAPVEISLDNASTLTANEVELEISSPFELTDLVFGGGSCERAGAGAVRYRCPIGILRSGDRRTVRGVLHAPAEIAAGQVESGLLSATATAAERIARPGTNSATAVVEAYSAIADLEAVVVSAPARIDAGADARLVVALRSRGGDAAPDASLRIELPGALTLLGIDDDRGACTSEAGSAVRCDVSTLADGEAVEVEITVVADRAGSYAWAASASHAGYDPNAANDAEERTLDVAGETAPGSSPSGAGGGGGGGGGGASWLLLALAALGLARRTRVVAR